MQLPEFDYLRPKSLSEGLAALAERGAAAKVMSGGSDLLLNMKYRLDTPDCVISINALPELQQIDVLDDGGLRIGAGCTLTALAENRLIRERYQSLCDAIASVGSRHVRNAGTLGGNICLDTRCWYTNQSETWRETREGCFKTDTEYCHVIKSANKCHAINSSDTAPALMVLDASLVLASQRGKRTVSIMDFYRDDGVDHTVLEADEILIEVIIPAPRGRAVYAKLASREGLDFASGTFAAAVRGSNEKPEYARLVMGSVGPEPKVLHDAQQIIMGSGLNDASIETAALAARASLGEVTNLYTPSGYKRRLVKALIRDALEELAQS